MIKKNQIDSSLLWILLIVFLIHIPVVFNDFHTDDFPVLMMLDKGFDLQTFLSMENPHNFRPVINLVLYLRHVILDKSTVLWYLLNICLHLVVISLLFYSVKSVTNKTTAILASLFFGIYFQHFEAVLWLYGIVRLMAAVFILLTLIYQSKAINDFSRSAALKSYLFFMLGLFCVEDIVVLTLFF